MSHYQTHSIEDIDTVLDLIRAGGNTKATVNGQRVKITSLRLQAFALYGVECSNCYIRGTYFAVQRSKGTEAYHLNLWCANDQGPDMLMTHDHTLSRGMGGSNTIDNVTTMCYACNQAKSITETPPRK